MKLRRKLSNRNFSRRYQLPHFALFMALNLLCFSGLAQQDSRPQYFDAEISGLDLFDSDSGSSLETEDGIFMASGGQKLKFRFKGRENFLSMSPSVLDLIYELYCDGEQKQHGVVSGYIYLDNEFRYFVSQDEDALNIPYDEAVACELSVAVSSSEEKYVDRNADNNSLKADLRILR